MSSKRELAMFEVTYNQIKAGKVVLLRGIKKGNLKKRFEMWMEKNHPEDMDLIELIR